MKKDNKNIKKQKVKSILKSILHIFCYIVTGVSLLLAVLMSIYSCNNTKLVQTAENLKRRNYLQQTQLVSSFGNFPFLPYRLPNITEAPNYTIDTSANTFRPIAFNSDDGYVFDVYVVNYSSTYSWYFDIRQSDGHTWVYINGLVYDNITSFSAFSNQITVNTEHISINSDYIVVSVAYDYYQDSGYEITYHGINTTTNFYDKFSYYCSFSSRDFHNSFPDEYITENNFNDLDGVLLDHSQQIIENQYENYVLDNRKFIFNPVYMKNNYWTCYLPLKVEEYYFNSYDDTGYTYYTNSISYGQFDGGQADYDCIGSQYIYSDSEIGYYAGSNINDLYRFEEKWTNPQSFSYWAKSTIPQVDKTTSEWQYKYYYNVYSFRGYFPKSLNSIEYTDIFLPFNDGAVTSTYNFRFSTQSLDLAYTYITGSTGSIRSIFYRGTNIFVRDRVWVATFANLSFFTYKSNTDWSGDDQASGYGGWTVFKNEPLYTEVLLASANSMNMNDFQWLLRGSYVADVDVPIWDEGSASIGSAISSIFDLLGNAFQGMVPFMNLSLGNGITLGVLFFTPLVVTVIFAIVKIFKR